MIHFISVEGGVSIINKEFGRKLRALRLNRGYSLRHLEKRSGISNSFISEVENGKVSIPTINTLKKLANGLRIPLSKILELAGIKPKMPKNAIIPHGYVKIPIVGSIPCGDPNTAIQETNKFKLVPDIEPHVGYMFLRADGRSMEPKIMDHALVKIHLQHTIENKEIAAVSINGADATLKQVVKDNNDKIVMFHPLNPEFKDIFPNADNQCRIIGKAVAVENPL